jgi:plastocyanin
MRQRRRFLATGLAIAFGGARAAPPAARQVVMENMAFMPAVATVRRGETVTWTNRDLFEHTVTSTSFDSGAIAPGRSWTMTATKAGRFAYACSLHPTMKATLVVE